MRSQVYVKLNMLRFSAEMECKMQPGKWHCEGRRKDEIAVMVLCPLPVSSGCCHGGACTCRVMRRGWDGVSCIE